MVDTHDLFKKLGCGAKFDLKRFKDDADKFQIINKYKKADITSDAAEVLDFFGSKTNHTTTHHADRKKAEDKEHTIETETPGKKKKKIKKIILNDEEGQDESDIQLLRGTKKKKKMSEIKEKKLNKDQLKEKHIEKINLFRKEHKIYIHGSDISDPIESFEDLRKRYEVSSVILRNITTNNYTTPTPIQMQATPLMLQNRELLACAPTGSGKTLAFIIPLLCHLKEPRKVGFRAVVISPTRELSQQIYREFVRMNEGLGFRIHTLSKAKASSNNFGPNSSNKLDILIATPNRLVHLLKQDPPGINLSNVEWLVLDEGDKLFEEGDTGFREQVAMIYQACDNPSIKHALFSATLANQVEEWCKLHLDNVVRVTVGARNSATDTVDQELMFVGQESGKLLAMRQIIQKGFQPPVLVFVQSKERAKELFNELIYDGLNVDVIHADRTQAQRENVVKCFRTGKIWILIATELMGRGIDFKGVNMVVNYDFPPTAVSYIHRIGRTGRAGRKGKAITMFTEDDVVNLRSIVNVVRSSGCDVPTWMLQIKKPDRRTKKKLEKAPLKRAHINTISKYDQQHTKKRKQMIEMSKAKKSKNT